MNPSTETNTGNFIPFALPSIGREEEQAVLNVLRSRWLTTGRVTEEFESAFAELLNAQHALAVHSATAGSWRLFLVAGESE